MTASPLVIRRQGDYAIATPQQAAANGRHDNIGAPYGSTPHGKHFYGSTPGGTRIVYSREQLLMLASSPLTSSSQQEMFTYLPNEISRSPDKKTFDAGPNDIHRALNGQLYTASPQRTSPPWSTKQNGLPAPLNLSTSATRNVGLARSPSNSAAGSGALSGSKPRSPGNAFNFAAKGPITSAVTLSASNTSSFKERLEAAEAAAAIEQQTKQRRSSGSSGRSDGDDTFTMEM